jgi:Lar family restriction alleviation protein
MEKCPFCGQDIGKEKFNKETGELKGLQFVCNHCQAEGPLGVNEEDAKRKWNHRVMADNTQCPFCGSSETNTREHPVDVKQPDVIFYSVECSKCHSSTQYAKGKSEAYATWAKRK